MESLPLHYEISKRSGYKVECTHSLLKSNTSGDINPRIEHPATWKWMAKGIFLKKCLQGL